MEIVVDEIVCDQSHLEVGTLKPGKDPLGFEMEHITLHSVGVIQPAVEVSSRRRQPHPPGRGAGDRDLRAVGDGEPR